MSDYVFAKIGRDELRLPAHALRLLAALRIRALKNDETKVSWSTLAIDLGLTLSAIKKTRKVLEGAGLLAMDGRFKALSPPPEPWIKLYAAEVYDHRLVTSDIPMLLAIRELAGANPEGTWASPERELAEMVDLRRTQAYDHVSRLEAAGRIIKKKSKRANQLTKLIPVNVETLYSARVLRPWDLLRHDRTAEDIACLRSIPVSVWDAQELWAGCVAIRGIESPGQALSFATDYGKPRWWESVFRLVPRDDDHQAAQILWSDDELVETAGLIERYRFHAIADSIADFLHEYPKAPRWKTWRSHLCV